MLFQKIQDARAFTVAGGQPYGAAMIVNVAYALIFNTGLFPNACRACQSRAIARKTWAQFKLDFATAHREFRLTNQTAQQSGFHSANMMIGQGRDKSMQDTVDAITQLATATASDCGTVATLTTTNAKLATQLEARDCDTEEQDQTCLAGTTTHQNNNQRQLLLVAWLSGSEIAYERNMQHEKERTSGCSEQEQHHGRSPMGQEMMGRGS
jgi:hypothetical protein